MGLVERPGGAARGRDRNVPAMTRMGYRINAASGCKLSSTSLLLFACGGANIYNRNMRGWSIPLGRWMGVELRVHMFFPVLALVFFGISGSDGWQRGLVLFFILILAVLVRETARLLVAAWMGLRLRAVLLLPIGGLFAYANPESQDMANQGGGQFAIALTGPLANWATAAVMTAAVWGASPNVPLYGLPLIGSANLLRSLIWMQFFMGALHLLPAYPLDFGRLLRGKLCAHAWICSGGPRRDGTGPGDCADRNAGRHVAARSVAGAGGLFHHDWRAD